MKKSLSLLALLCLFAMPLLAQLKDLTINADKVSVEREKHLIEAEGSVEAYYKDFTLYGQHLVYNTSTETFRANNGFTLLYQGITFEGSVLDYDIKGKSGVASKVTFLYQGVLMGGGRLSFNPDQFEIKNSYFTTCDLRYPHYHVTAADLNVYPKYGWMVAYWGLFWLWQVPVVPMPTYIYDFRAAEKAQQNIPPFPSFGADQNYGNYVTETLAWYLRPELSGTYSLSYYANKGLGLGGVANYIINDDNNGNVRLNWNAKDNYSGGVTHGVSFGEKINPGNGDPFAFLSSQARRYRLDMTLSSREWLNYQLVSFQPNLVLQANRLELSQLGLKSDLELAAGRVEEQGTLRARRAGGKIKFYKEFPDTQLGTITPSLAYDGLVYSNGSQWIRPSLGFSAYKTISGPLALGLNYTHYLYFYGASPFLYENYLYRPADTLQGNLKFGLGATQAKIATVYYLDNWTPQDIDYTLFFKLHCYNLEATYRSIRGEFMLGFSLASQ